MPGEISAPEMAAAAAVVRRSMERLSESGRRRIKHNIDDDAWISSPLSGMEQWVRACLRGGPGLSPAVLADSWKDVLKSAVEAPGLGPAGE